MAALRRLRLFIVSTVLQCGPKYMASDTVSLLISVEFHLIHTLRLCFLPNFIKVRHLVTQQSVTVNLLCRFTHYCSAEKKGTAISIIVVH